MELNRVYVTGHKHPDSDSVASAIGYAFYKRANGIKAIPCRLGKLSAETKYLLKRFGFEMPMLLEDARYKLGEIDLDEPVSIEPDKTLFEAIQILQKNNRQICSVVDPDGKLLGIVTRSDAADLSMGDTESTSKLSPWGIRRARRSSFRIHRWSVYARPSAAGSSTMIL